MDLLCQTIYSVAEPRSPSPLPRRRSPPFATRLASAFCKAELPVHRGRTYASDHSIGLFQSLCSIPICPLDRIATRFQPRVVLVDVAFVYVSLLSTFRSRMFRGTSHIQRIVSSLSLPRRLPASAKHDETDSCHHERLNCPVPRSRVHEFIPTRAIQPQCHSSLFFAGRRSLYRSLRHSQRSSAFAHSVLHSTTEKGAFRTRVHG